MVRAADEMEASPMGKDRFFFFFEPGEVCSDASAIREWTSWSDDREIRLA